MTRLLGGGFPSREVPDAAGESGERQPNWVASRVVPVALGRPAVQIPGPAVAPPSARMLGPHRVTCGHGGKVIPMGLQVSTGPRCLARTWHGRGEPRRETGADLHERWWAILGSNQ
jgi:hypothetical protein